MRTLKLSVFTLTALMLGVAMVGCGGGGGGGNAPGADTTAPTVTVRSYTQATRDSLGGPATIQVEALDAVGVTTVYAIVTPPSGTPTTWPLTSLGGGMYSVTFPAAANAGVSDVTYGFVVRAGDAAGNLGTTSTYYVRVPSSENPPPPPF